MTPADPRRLSDAEPDASEIVANASLNRGRGLTGGNSYERALGLDVEAFLRERLANDAHVAWLDGG